jgi:hypothetical protein
MTLRGWETGPFLNSSRKSAEKGKMGSEKEGFFENRGTEGQRGILTQRIAEIKHREKQRS